MSELETATQKALEAIAFLELLSPIDRVGPINQIREAPHPRWSEAMDAELYKAWYVEGLSTSRCAQRLNRVFNLNYLTKSAIIGRIHRRMESAAWPQRMSRRSAAALAGAATRKANHDKHFPGLVPPKKSVQGHPRGLAMPRIRKGNNGTPEKSYFTLRRTTGDGSLIENGKTIAEATGCLYAIGHDSKGRHVFCDCPKVPGTSWCEVHHGLVYMRRE